MVCCECPLYILAVLAVSVVAIKGSDNDNAPGVRGPWRHSTGLICTGTLVTGTNVQQSRMPIALMTFRLRLVGSYVRLGSEPTSV